VSIAKPILIGRFGSLFAELGAFVVEVVVLLPCGALTQLARANAQVKRKADKNDSLRIKISPVLNYGNLPN
jgi:hypothetical protein